MVEQIKNGLKKVSEKFKSRRYFSMWALTVIIVLLFLLPPFLAFVVNAVTGSALVFAILDQTAFSGLLAWIWATYLASDYKTKSLGQYIDNMPDIGTDEPRDQEERK